MPESILIPREVWARLCSDLTDIRAEITRLREDLRGYLFNAEELQLKAAGLIGYKGLQMRLAIDGKSLSKRQIQRLVKRYEKVIPKVELGHCVVGFRPRRVEAFIAALEGTELEPLPGSLRL